MSNWNGRISKNRELSVAESVMLQRLHIARLKSGLKEPINQDILVRFSFFFKNYWTKPRSKKEIPRRSEKLGDLSNLYQLPEDCLTKSLIIRDDCLICSHDGSRRLPGQENGLEIVIYAFEEIPY